MNEEVVCRLDCLMFMGFLNDGRIIIQGCLQEYQVDRLGHIEIAYCLRRKPTETGDMSFRFITCLVH